MLFRMAMLCQIIDDIIEEGRRSRRPVVVPEYAGTRGNPVMFHATIFAELRAIAGDQGARAVVARDPARVATVRFPFDMPADVDTPDDYARLTNQSEAPGFRGNPSGPRSL